jgi:hypothetical protein
VAIGFLVFLGAVIKPTEVRADPGDFCLVSVTDEDGDSLVFNTDTDRWIIEEDQTAWILVEVEDWESEDTLNGSVDQDVDIDLDDDGGDSEITSVDRDGDGETEEINPTDFLDDEPIQPEGANLPDCGDPDESLLSDLRDDVEEIILEAIDTGEDCSSLGNPSQCDDPNPGENNDGDEDDDGGAVNDHDIDCGAFPLGSGCGWDSTTTQAAIDAITDGLWNGDDCQTIAEAAEDAILDNWDGDSLADMVFIAGQFEDFVQGDDDAEFPDQICDLADGINFGLDGFVLIDVTCEDAGNFDVSYSSDDDEMQVEFSCVGEIDAIELTATPGKIEIVPAAGSVSYSLIVAKLLDENEDPVAGSRNVQFSTDLCEFNDEDGLTEEEFNFLGELFADYHVNDLGSAEDIQEALRELDYDDPDDESNDVASFVLDDDIGDFDEGDNVAAIILDCSGFDSEPGVATIEAEVDTDDADVEASVKVTVVGPPAAPLVVAADPAGPVRCGERVTITVTVKDAKGQAVSDHTLLEAVTNFGGVLGGTGAVAGGFGLVTPVSSTVAETHGGVATFSLLTSETHEGPYVVVVSTGGGGAVTTVHDEDEDDEDEDHDGDEDDETVFDELDEDLDDNRHTSVLGGHFSTPVVTGQVTVACTVPAAAAPQPAPTVRAPSTGQGITPPSTGDAGLADASGSSLALFAIAGLVMVAVAGVASVKFARR